MMILLLVTFSHLSLVIE